MAEILYNLFFYIIMAEIAANTGLVAGSTGLIVGTGAKVGLGLYGFSTTGIVAGSSAAAA